MPEAVTLRRGSARAAAPSLLLTAALAALAAGGCARSLPRSPVPGELELTPSRLSRAADCFGGVPALWRFRAGDDPRWAQPGFDDSRWPTIDARMHGGPPAGWRGVGWFRLKVKVAEALRGKLLVAWVANFGSLDLYLDGRRVAVKRHVQPWIIDAVPIRFDKATHVLAVRFASKRVATLSRLFRHGGVQLSLSRLDTARWWGQVSVQRDRLHYTVIGLAVALALLHLMMFAFRREGRENLYHGLSIVAVALLAYSSLRMGTVHGASIVFWNGVFEVSVISASLAGLRLIYALFVDSYEPAGAVDDDDDGDDVASERPHRAPPRFWVLSALALASLLATLWLSRTAVYVGVTLLLAEQSRVLIAAALARKPGARVMGVGIVTWSACACLSMLSDAQMLSYAAVVPYVYLYGFVALMMAVSLTLARGSARDKRDLARQLAEIEKLSASTLEQQRELALERIARQALQAEAERKALKVAEATKRAAVLSEVEQVNRKLHAAQAQVVQAQKMSALGGLVAGLAHEVNTPIGAINSMQASLSRVVERLRGALGDEGARWVDEVEVAAGMVESRSARVEEVINRLRSFARLDEASLKRVDLHDTLDDALALVRHQFGESVQVERHYGELPPVVCDPRKLGQVFMHLLVNARQAIDGAGVVRLTSAAVEDAEVVVRVSDDGRGVPHAEQQRIFEAGVSLEDGAGLGLAVCRTLVEEHDGRIELSSVPGEGTTVSVWLPVAGPADLGAGPDLGEGDEVSS